MPSATSSTDAPERDRWRSPRRNVEGRGGSPPGLQLEVRRTFIEVPETSAGSRVRTLRGWASYPDDMGNGAQVFDTPLPSGVENASIAASVPIPDSQESAASHGALDSQDSAFSFQQEILHPADSDMAEPP